MKRPFPFRKVPFFLFIAIPMIFVLGWVVMSLWNNVLANILAVKAVTFWQALGIFLLAKILFGGFSGGRGWRGRDGKWNNEMREKWSAMTPEEKAKFKQEWKDRCNRWRGSSKTETTITE